MPSTVAGSMPGPAMISIVLGVIRVVGAGVVLERVDALVAAERRRRLRQSRSPKMHDEVGRNAVR